jgi:hypothetical protein
MTILSMQVVHRLVGWAGVAVYAVAATGWAVVLAPRLARWLDAQGRQIRIVAASVGLAVVASLLAVGYPLSRSGRFGQGSDRADALNIAATRLLEGLYPYDAVTYLGGKITPLPGAVLLAVPFVWAFGTVVVQNLALAGALLWALRETAPSSGSALTAWATVMVLIPETLREFVTGGDLFVSAILPLVALALVCRAAARGATMTLVAAAALLGFSVCTRPHMMLLPVLAVGWMWGRRGGGTAAIVAGTSAATFLVVALPFYLADPAGFSPLHVAGKTTGETTVTTALVLQAAVAAAVVAGAAWWLSRRSFQALLTSSAVVLAAPAVLSIVNVAAGGGGIDVGLVGFAAPAAVFVVAAWQMSLHPSGATRRDEINEVGASTGVPRPSPPAG